MSDEPPVVMGNQQRQPPAGKLDWLTHNKILLLAMLFLVTAALGLPLLWKSPKFSHREKIVWSIIVAIYTVIIFWIFGAIMWWSYARIASSLR